jgi:hypothetical protein
MKSSLAKVQGKTPRSEEELFKLKRDEWVNDGYLAISKEQQATLSNKLFEAAQEIDNHFYGKRK